MPNKVNKSKEINGRLYIRILGLPVFSFTLSFDLLLAESNGDRKLDAATPERPILSS